MNRSFRHSRRRKEGFTLPEVLLAAALMSMVAYASSTIYFSVLNIHQDTIWQVHPYDEATRAAQRVADDLREAMLIESHGPTYIVAVVPEQDAAGDYVLTPGEDGYSLMLGDRVVFYLSDETGSLEAQGSCLWRGVQPQGSTTFSRTIKLADNIHPELNPVDPETGQPRPMFRYWPDESRLWGVELWMTSTAEVHGQTMTQTAYTEVYFRNI